MDNRDRFFTGSPETGWAAGPETGWTVNPETGQTVNSDKNRHARAMRLGLFCTWCIVLLGYVQTLVAYEDNLKPVCRFRQETTGIVHVYDVQVQNDTAFCSGYGGVSIFDISDISGPVHLGNYNPSLFPGRTFYRRMTVQGHTIFITRGYGGIDAVDFTNPLNPYLLSTYSHAPDISYEHCCTDGDILYAAVHHHGVEAIDISDPSNPVHIGFIDTQNAFSVAVEGHSLYVADREEGLLVLNVSATAAYPHLLWKLPTTGAAQFVRIEDKVAYVAVGSSGFDIFGIGGTQGPVFLSNVPAKGFCTHVSAGDGKLLMAEWDLTRLFDVTDPTSPVRIATEDANKQAMGAAFRDSLVFVADWDSVRVYLFHEGNVPDLYMDRHFLSFGDVVDGQRETQTVTLENLGGENLTFTGMESSDPAIFQVNSSSFIDEAGMPVPLSPGASRSLEVTFTPSSADQAEAVIHLETDDPDHEGKVSLPVFAGYPDLGPGDAAPDFELPVFGTWESCRLSGFRGKVVLLIFYASW